MIFKRKVQILVAIVSFVLCFSITLQYKSAIINKGEKKQEPVKTVTPKPGDKINKTDERITILEKENMQLSTDLEAYRQMVASNDSGAAAIKAELDRQKVFSGFTDVEGPGITIVVSDSMETDENTDYQSDLIVHDTDLLKIVNELYAAGAEAVSINEERLIMGTPIRCVGNSIMVNHKKFSSPYEIKAIGNAASLESAINIRGGIAEELKKSSIGINVTKSDKLSVPAYVGVVTFSYAVNSKK